MKYPEEQTGKPDRPVNPIYIQHFNTQSKLMELINVLSSLTDIFGVNIYISDNEFMKTLERIYRGARGYEKYKVINDLRRLGLLFLYRRCEDSMEQIPLIANLREVSERDRFFLINAEVIGIISAASRSAQTLPLILRTWVSYNRFINKYTSIIIKYKQLEVEYAMKILINDVLEEEYKDELLMCKMYRSEKYRQKLRGLEVLKRNLNDKKYFINKFIRVLEVLSNKCIRRTKTDYSIVIDSENLMSTLSDKLMQVYDITYRTLVELYMNIVKRKGLEHLLQSGKPIMILLKELYEEAVNSGVIPKNVTLKDFYKRVHALSLIHENIRLFVHPLYADKPEEGCHVIIFVY